MEIGKHIREQAKQRGIKLADLAKAIGSDPKHLSQVIDSENIKVKTLYQVANVIGCKVTDLLGIPTIQVTAENSVINIVVDNNKNTK